MAEETLEKGAMCTHVCRERTCLVPGAGQTLLWLEPKGDACVQGVSLERGREPGSQVLGVGGHNASLGGKHSFSGGLTEIQAKGK